MKRIVTPILAVIFALFATVTVAQQDNSKPNQPDDKNQSTSSAGTLEGTVSQIDQSGKSFVLRDTSGKEVTIYWDQTTRLMGPEANQGSTSDRSGQTGSSMAGLKVGDEVTVNASTQGDKQVASSVQVRPKKSS
jgi:hypothetical protein